MIVFNLHCGNDHHFEGWFASFADFEEQQRAAMLSCPSCGSTEINKGLHAPRVNTGNAPPPAPREEGADDKTPQYANVGEQLSRLVDYVIANSEDVGDAFPEEARKIHYKETPERRIRGHASREEVGELREEGIEVIALPIPPHRAGKMH